jgi:predicted Zn-dependent protease
MFAGQALADGNLESAQKYFDAGEFKKAVGLLKEVTKEEPSNTKAWILLGNSYTGLEKNKNAIKAYEREAHYELGVSYDRTNHLTYAFEQYKILKTLDERLADKLYHIILGS